jgi:hypothetical protein
MIEDEIWRPVVGAADYEVSTRGQVRHRVNGQPKVPTTRCGELVVNLYANGKSNVRNVRSLVAEAFIRPRRRGEMVIHKDGNKTNCSADNLAYASLSTRRPGERAGQAHSHGGKLTSEQADEIRTRASRGEAVGALAREFGVSAPLVSNIKRGLKWRKTNGE